MRTSALLALSATAGFGVGAVAVDGDPPAVVVESLRASTVVPPASDDPPPEASRRALEVVMTVRVPRSMSADVAIETRAACTIDGDVREDGQRAGDLDRAVRERNLSLTLFANRPLAGEPDRCELSARLLRPERPALALGEWCYRDGTASLGRCDRSRLERVAVASPGR